VPGFGEVVLAFPGGAAGGERAGARQRPVAILLSGDQGWDATMKEMARALTAGGALVAGVDVPGFTRRLGRQGECWYIAGNFESLAQAVEKRLGLGSYTPPVLVGWSLGAVLAYAALAEAPPGTFLGAVSLGFRPQAALERPLCAGRALAAEPGPQPGTWRFRPAPALAQPWVLLHGGGDPSFPAAAAADYVRRVGHGQLLALPGAGPRLPAAAAWQPRLRQAFIDVVRAPRPAGDEGESPGSAAALADLPLFELPGKGRQAGALAVVVSGDGGWSGIDRKVTRALAEQGIAVVGLNSRRYFWTARTPARAAVDLERILRRYLAAWNCRQALLVGYSLGADALALTAGRLPPDLLARVRLIALLAPDSSVRLEVGADLEPAQGGTPELDVLPAVRRLAGHPLLCLYGERETDSLCPRLTAAEGRAERLPGSHAFDGDAAAVTARILAVAKLGPAAATP